MPATSPLTPSSRPDVPSTTTTSLAANARLAPSTRGGTRVPAVVYDSLSSDSSSSSFASSTSTSDDNDGDADDTDDLGSSSDDISAKPGSLWMRPGGSTSSSMRSASSSSANSSDSDDDIEMGGVGGGGGGADTAKEETGDSSDSDASSLAADPNEPPDEPLPGTFWRHSGDSSSSSQSSSNSSSNSSPPPTPPPRTATNARPTARTSPWASLFGRLAPPPAPEPQPRANSTRTRTRARTRSRETPSSSSPIPIPTAAATSGATANGRSRKQAAASNQGRTLSTSPADSIGDAASPGVIAVLRNPMMADARDQARLLLVSLLENFCQLYNPSDNQLLFQILCEKLSLMGIIREEDFDEHFSAVRGVYKLAFKELVTQALVAVRTARDSAQQRISPQSSLLLEYLPDGASGNGGGADEDATVESDEDVDDVRSSSESSGPMAFLLDNASTPRNATPAPLLSGSLAVTSVMAPVPSTSPQSSSITATRGVTPETIVDLLDLHTSRYATDFTEIRRLGRGGFGSVFHVRNKLDGREYAVKKVTLSDPKDLHRVLREVKVLARMDHPNIVRYHSAWLEYEDRRLPGTRPGAGPSSSSSMQSQDSDASFGTDGASATDDSTTGEGVGVTFTREEEDSWANRTSKGAAADGDSDAADAAASRSRSREKKPTRPSPRNERSLPPVNPARPLTLKIQMELCYSSLHDWLMHRNTLRHLKPWMLMAEANFLFRSLLCGLEYVQERGTSHRDLTPRNMFLVRKEHQIQHRAIQRRKSAASSSSSSGSSSRSRKISGESVFSDLDADEAALPLCQWLNVETLDDVGIKIGDFGLVSEHGRPGASSSSYSSPSISPLPRTGSGVSIGFGRLPEPSVLLGQPSRGSPVSASDKEDAESVTLTAATAAPLPRGGKAPPPPPLPLAKLRPAAAARSTPPGSEAGSPISPRFPPYQSPVNGMPSLNSNMSTPTNNGVVAPPVPLRPIPRLPSFAPTIGIGTATYSAPEQIARSGKYAWHRVTSDMYSLGVVLLELLCPFATGMERFVTLERLRAIHDCDRRLPPDLITTFPGHAAMILWLTAEDPTQRPSPGEMLTVFPPPVPDALVKHAPSDLQKTPLYEESYEFVPDPGSLPPESPLPLPKLTSASLAGAGGDRERLEHLARTVRQQQAIIESKDQEIALLRAKLASVLGGSVN